MRDNEVVQIGPRKRPFAQLPNALLRDSRLSAKVTGILCYLLSHSDEWEIHLSSIRERFGIGIKPVRNALRELRRLGYAELRALKNSKGEFCGKYYIVREEPRNPTKTGTSGNGGPPPNGRGDNNTSYYSLKNTNSRAARRPGQTSLFPEKELPKAVVRYAEFTVRQGWHRGVLGNNGHGWGKTALKQWCIAYHRLRETVSSVEVKGVMDWYFEHWNDSMYVPKAHTLPGFCKKFVGIKEAIDRERHRQNGEEPTHRRSITNEYDEA